MAKSFNYEILKKEIDTQYNNMCGIAAIDGHDFSYLHQLCTGTGSASPVIVGTGRKI